MPDSVRQRLPVRFYAWQPSVKEDAIRQNFGDELFHAIVSRLTGTEVRLCEPSYLGRKALIGGSTLGFARPGDFVWGPGLRDGEVPEPVRDLRVFAVRGPLTAEALRRKGISVPQVYGDPAILFPKLFPEVIAAGREEPVGLVPHFREMLVQPLPPRVDGAKVIRADRPYAEVLTDISRCRRIVSSSLHGIICAEVLGIPVEPYKIPGRHAEPDFKFQDYYASTGREWRPHRDIKSALAGGFQAPPDVTGAVNDLLQAFGEMRKEMQQR